MQGTLLDSERIVQHKEDRKTFQVSTHPELRSQRVVTGQQNGVQVPPVQKPSSAMPPLAMPLSTMPPLPIGASPVAKPMAAESPLQQPNSTIQSLQPPQEIADFPQGILFPIQDVVVKPNFPTPTPDPRRQNIIFSDKVLGLPRSQFQNKDFRCKSLLSNDPDPTAERVQQRIESEHQDLVPEATLIPVATHEEGIEPYPEIANVNPSADRVVWPPPEPMIKAPDSLKLNEREGPVVEKVFAEEPSENQNMEEREIVVTNTPQN